MTRGTRVRRKRQPSIGTVEFRIAYEDSQTGAWWIAWCLVRWDGKRNRTMVQTIDLEEIPMEAAS